MLDNEPIYRCPWAEQARWIDNVIRWHRDFQALGVIPLGLDNLNQAPVWLVDAFRICAEYDEQARIAAQATLLGGLPG